MRNGWRKAWIIWGIALLGAASTAAPADQQPTEPLIQMTVEIDWNLPSLPTLPTGPEPITVTLGVDQGRVVEALAWPDPRSRGPSPTAGGPWRLGSEGSGRVRARVEAPIGATLTVQAGGQSFPFSLMALLEGPQRTAPPSLANVGVERLAWDPLEVCHDGDGTAEPGTAWPLTVGFNVLTPMQTEVSLRFSAELRPIRGGSPLWRTERSQVVVTNTASPPTLALNVPAPQTEGTYVLDIQSIWEPLAGRESSALGRWLKRRRGQHPASTASRQTTLAVVGVVGGTSAPGPSPGIEVTADLIDPSRIRAHRETGSGRSPAASALPTMRTGWMVPEPALFELRRADRLRNLIGRGGTDLATLAPADASGLAWSAFGLRVPHPGRPHRLSLTVLSGPPNALGVALIARSGPRGNPRVLLDVCAASPSQGDGAPLTLTWPVWPDVTEPIVIVFNRDPEASVRLGSIALNELAAPPPPLLLAETHAEAPRTLALYLPSLQDLERFGGHVDDGLSDTLELAGNLTRYLKHCGASTTVLPEGLADRARRLSLDGQADEDGTGPDRFDQILHALAARGLSALIDVRLDDNLPGLPPVDSAEALAKGLVRIDQRGLADGPAYQPLRLEVREALRLRIEAAISPRRSHPNLTGLLVRLGPGCTLPGSPETGLDDETYARFAHSLRPETARELPGLGTVGLKRFAARHDFLSGAGSTAWLDWRSREVGALYLDLSRAVRQTAPGAVLAVATPGLDNGPAGAQARRHDQMDRPPDRAWCAVGLDLRRWPLDVDAPTVLRGVAPTTDDLAHDLAVAPDLDAQVAARPERGLLLLDSANLDKGLTPGSGSQADPLAFQTRISNPNADHGPWTPARSAGPILVSRPGGDGPEADQPLGHALAVLDARWVVIEAGAVIGHEERVRHFARVLRGLPAPNESGPPHPRLDSGVAARTWTDSGHTYMALANDTPYTLRVDMTLAVPAEVSVDDLGRGLSLLYVAAPGGGRRLVVELGPFGVSALRIGRPAVRPERLALHFRNGPEPQAMALRDCVGRFGQALTATGPPNPGFEVPRPTTAEIKVARRPALACGWAASGDPSNAVEIDDERPHNGQGSLRLDAKALPTAAFGDWFLPPGGSPLTLRAWLRSDLPETQVRVWLDGQVAGQPIARFQDVAAKSAWTPITLTFADLPARGLDQARLRFEPLAAGRLWIDDLALTGQGPSESAARAQSVLVAAIQAFDEGRYADFARLVGSHRARLVPQTLIDDPTSLIRTGRANDLPKDRRLR
ncbi:MAG: hypothetical protein ABI353_06105 [Isosphaeraceae bacterium]